MHRKSERNLISIFKPTQPHNTLMKAQSFERGLNFISRQFRHAWPLMPPRLTHIAHIKMQQTLNCVPASGSAWPHYCRSAVDFTLYKPSLQTENARLLSQYPQWKKWLADRLSQSKQFHGSKKRHCVKDESSSGMHPHLHSPWRGLPGTAAVWFASCVRSCDQPHSVRWGGSWIHVVNIFSAWELFLFFGRKSGWPRSVIFLAVWYIWCIAFTLFCSLSALLYPE